jgi:hypothetical protein
MPESPIHPASKSHNSNSSGKPPVEEDVVPWATTVPEVLELEVLLRPPVVPVLDVVDELVVDTQ